MLLSKVIQNLANGVEFGQKEPFMLPMNTFLTEFRAPYDTFVDSVAVRRLVQNVSNFARQTEQSYLSNGAEFAKTDTRRQSIAVGCHHSVRHYTMLSF